LAINAELFDRYWRWLKVEVSAPTDLPEPLVQVEPLPSQAKMALFYPTAQSPETRLRIVISPRAIQRAKAGKRLEVLGELAHEVVHYMLLLNENGWNHESPTFNLAEHHHCDLEFQRLTKHVGTVIWNAYHSADAVRAIESMVQRSCWTDGHRIGESRR
jgi:hypothetical protein